MENIWDQWNRQSAPKYPHNKLIQFLLRIFKENRQTIKILDLGCGSGANTKFLCEQGFMVYATDFSYVAIQNTKMLLSNYGLKYIDMRVENISDLSYPDNFFDCIVSVGVFESAGYYETIKCVPKIKQCLKEGGIGFFLFAANDDFRMLNNTMSLYGYSEEEVRLIFSPHFSNMYIDHYITTFNNQQIKEHDFIVTVKK